MSQPAAVNKDTARYLIIFPNPTTVFDAAVYESVDAMLEAENGTACTVYWINYPAGELIEVEILYHEESEEFEMTDATTGELLEYVAIGDGGKVVEQTIYGTGQSVAA